MTEKDLLNYYLASAQDSLETAESLFKSKKYHFCLFFCQLALEKLLKGLVFKNTKNHAQLTHDLKKLSTQSRIPINGQQEKDFDEITTWNIDARYDTVKLKFFKKATKQFTALWFTKVKDYYLWLKNQY